ncbi:EF-hand calcium-binding domain-containing protein 14-like isoform X2 [Limulus polyphemus]|uniref:EF-hand calcium-binding domain-containing protein 14-like isoform X2 n=1 Tax=Limulus polyphemus TaxID=6850 RepID=A0ABM1RUW6_LIMPO|nr:EF-hand calcium-binding domain-containing protein 14-like isoform X2 [Limulus polyphemus]
MRKRKELDALVPNGKLGKRANQTSSSRSASAHELLGNFSDTSDIEDFSVQKSKRHVGRKGSNGAACLPLCLFVLVSLSIIAGGTLAWLHLGIRQDLDLLRNHLQKVEAGNKNTPDALHSIHSQLRGLENNVSTLVANLKKIVSEVSTLGTEIEKLEQTTKTLKDSIVAAPEIKELPKDVSSLSENVASFGSKIAAMETTVSDLKNQQSFLQVSQEELTQAVTNIEVEVHELSNTTEYLSNPTAQIQITQLSEELLRVTEAVCDLNETVLPVIWKIHHNMYPLINKSATCRLEDLNLVTTKIITIYSQSQIMELYHNITSHLQTLAPKKNTLKGKKEQLELQQNDLQQMVDNSVNNALRNKLNDLLTAGVVTSTDVTWPEMLKKAQDMVHLYSELIYQLNGSLNTEYIIQDGSGEAAVGQLLNATLSSLIKDYEDELKTMQENVHHLLVQYSQLQSAQAATEYKSDTALSKLYYLEKLIKKSLNPSLNQDLDEEES